MRAAPLRRPGTIIPLFYPPDHLSPAQIACIDAMCYSSKALTASIVNLAVQGVITIQAHKNKLSFAPFYVYVLHKIAGNGSEVFKKLGYYEAFLAKKIFPKDTIECKLSDGIGPAVVHDFKLDLERHLKLHHYVEEHTELRQTLLIASICGFLAVIACAISFARYAWIMNMWMAIMAVAMVAVHWWGTWLVKHYTQRGREVKDRIDGFKLFLQTTEQDRLEIIGTPPEETPQLYETYLPYAIALGVEERWTKKFAALFARMEQAGTTYVPVWYHGAFSYHSTPFGHMTHTVNNVSSASISSGYRSGSRSGFGSGGGAGRGGGGGGGGGW